MSYPHLERRKSIRDMSIPYTEDELQEMRQIFRSLKTYKDGYVYAEDVPVFIQALKWERTPEQVAAYKSYWESEWDGKCTEEVFINFGKVLGSSSGFAKEFAITADKDKKRHISAQKFIPILKVMNVHDSRLGGLTYEDFVKEVGSSGNDGRVDIEEFARWIAKYAQDL